MQRLGFHCAELDDPYSAMAELCRRPMVYRAVILSLAGLYREELLVVQAIKRRFPHMEIWLAHTDGRQAALADAMRYGADGLLSEEGLHRMAIGTPAPTAGAVVPAPVAAPPRPADPVPVMNPLPLTPAEPTESSSDPMGSDSADSETNSVGEPVLTADELRALLQEQPTSPPRERGMEHD